MEQGLKTDFDDLLDPPEPSEQGDESAEPAAGPIPVVAEQAVEPAVAEAVAGAIPMTKSAPWRRPCARSARHWTPTTTGRAADRRSTL